MISLFELFIAFFKVGVLAFGGAYAAIPLIEQQIVDVTGWMSYKEFYDLIAIDELTPGPIIINSSTFIGTKLAEIPGAIIATLACVLPGILVSFVLIYLYKKYKNIPIISEIMNCLKSMSVALIFSTFLTILISTLFPNGTINLKDINYLSVLMIFVSFFLLKKYNPNPILIMLLCGAVSLVISFI